MKIQKQHLCYSFFTGIDETATVDLKRPKPEELALNSEVLLKCQINGNPDLLFDWYRNTFRLAEEQQKEAKYCILTELTILWTCLLALDNSLHLF